MAGGQLDVDAEALDRVAGRVESAVGQVSGPQGEPPGEVRAGRLTAALSAVVAQLARDNGTLSGQLEGTAGAVRSAGAEFAQVEEHTRRSFPPIDPDVQDQPMCTSDGEIVNVDESSGGQA